MKPFIGKCHNSSGSLSITHLTDEQAEEPAKIARTITTHSVVVIAVIYGLERSKQHLWRLFEHPIPNGIFSVLDIYFLEVAEHIGVNYWVWE